MVGLTRQRFFGLVDGPLEHAEVVEDQRTGVCRHEIARIGRLPQIQRAQRFDLVARHAVVVLIGNQEPFPLADAIAARIRFARVLSDCPSSPSTP